MNTILLENPVHKPFTCKQNKQHDAHDFRVGIFGNILFQELTNLQKVAIIFA